uniref:Protein kinase domain-containing protein n=1 Tax=Strigamia maritima TaxID=126957 RepID=T1J8U4_STRMM
MAQPDLDFTAPEIQLNGQCSPLSDMFSLGLVICSLFTRGHSLLEATHSSSNYVRQLDQLEDGISSVLEKLPKGLQEPLRKLLNRVPATRPSAQLFSLIQYFSDPVVHSLQYLDVIQMKDTPQKTNFYHDLKAMLPVIPRKLWFQHVFPCLRQEIQCQEAVASALQPILALIQQCNTEEYQGIIFPSIRVLFTAPKTVQTTVTLLENLPILLEKAPKEDIKTDVLPMLYSAFESATPQLQCAALQAVGSIADYLDEVAVRKMVLPRAKAVLASNTNIEVQASVLACLESIIDKLDKTTILDDVLPLLGEAKISDPAILLTVTNIYKLLLSNKKYGLTVNLLATRVLPSLVPQTVNPSLSLEEFTQLIQVLQEMMQQIDKNQRNKLKLDNLSLPVNEKSNLRQSLHSADNVPSFEISAMTRESKKTSASVEDIMQRGSSSGFVVLGPSSPDSNFLRVSNALSGRRHSDNVLLVPKIQVNPSSPEVEGKPGGLGGFPIRRHSSVGPPAYMQRPFVSQFRSNSEKESVRVSQELEPFCLQMNPSANPFSPLNTPAFPQGTRRFSCAVAPGGNLLQQLGSNVVKNVIFWKIVVVRVQLITPAS